MANFSLSDNALVNYIRNSREELGKVVWPSRSKVVLHTAIVIGISVVMGIVFGALDFGFNAGLQKLIEAGQSL
jgi:preprotein translocase SecE subunit